MTGSTLLWFAFAMFFFGMSAGIILGVIIDRDTVVNQIFKKLKIKRGTGDIIVDANQFIEDKGVIQRWRERRENRKSKKQD